MEAFLYVVLYQCRFNFLLGIIISFSKLADLLPIILEALILGLQYFCNMAIYQLFWPLQFLEALSNLKVRVFYR